MHNEVTYTIKLGSAELKILAELVKGTKSVERRLIQIEKKINIMNENEMALDAKLTELQKSLDDSQQRALDAIATAKAAIAVIQSQVETLTALVEELRTNSPELTDEIATVQSAIDDSNAFLAENPTDIPPA